MAPSARLISQAASELEELRECGTTRPFPLHCRRLLRQLPGNLQCADCGADSPEWASVSYGCLVCLVCSGRHRSYGVRTSVVRSVELDAWSHSQVLSVLEGGNGQLDGFFSRHCLGRNSAKATTRYHTKAARFYKTNLSEHVRLVSESGQYRGREASRRLHRRKTKPDARNPPRVAAPSLQQPITVQ